MKCLSNFSVTKMATIKFKRYKSYLSNHFPCPIRAYGMDFNCSEQHYLYLKATTLGRDDIVSKIMKETKGGNMSLINKREFTDTENAIWKNYSDQAMWTCLLTKFMQNRDLLYRLIGTNGFHLQEDTNNPYWGGRNNALGKMLMELRDRHA